MFTRIERYQTLLLLCELFTNSQVKVSRSHPMNLELMTERGSKPKLKAPSTGKTVKAADLLA